MPMQEAWRFLILSFLCSKSIRCCCCCCFFFHRTCSIFRSLFAGESIKNRAQNLFESCVDMNLKFFFTPVLWLMWWWWPSFALFSLWKRFLASILFFLFFPLYKNRVSALARSSKQLQGKPGAVCNKLGAAREGKGAKWKSNKFANSGSNQKKKKKRNVCERILQRMRRTSSSEHEKIKQKKGLKFILSFYKGKTEMGKRNGIFLSTKMSTRIRIFMKKKPIFLKIQNLRIRALRIQIQTTTKNRASGPVSHSKQGPQLSAKWSSSITIGFVPCFCSLEFFKMRWFWVLLCSVCTTNTISTLPMVCGGGAGAGPDSQFLEWSSSLSFLLLLLFLWTPRKEHKPHG